MTREFVVGFRLKKEEAMKLNLFAFEQGLNRSVLIRRIIEEYVMGSKTTAKEVRAYGSSPTKT